MRRRRSPTNSLSEWAIDKEHRNLFAIKHYGPASVEDFNAEERFDKWMGFTSKDAKEGTSRTRRNLASLLRKIMFEAQAKFDSGCGGGGGGGGDDI